jgi:D-aspartate ligase
VSRDQKTAVVVGVGSVGALATIRSLGRLGARVIAVHQTSKAIGFRSRFADEWLSPDPRADETGFIESLVALGKSLAGPVPIFAIADPHLDAMARHHEALKAHFLFPYSDGESIQRLRDKGFQAERAAAAGIPAPRTMLASAEEVTFPVIVKSSDSALFVERFGVKGVRCDTPEELGSVLGRAHSLSPVVQEWIPGDDEDLYLVGAYLSQGGQALGIVSCRKLQQAPRHIGTIRVGEAFPMPEVEELALAFLRAAKCYGPSDVEFKRDARDGQLKFIEANPRLVQWQGLAAAAGIDIAAIAYRDLIGSPAKPARQTEKRKRWAITFLTGSGHERAGFGGSGPVIPKLPYTDAVFALDDPWPTAVQLGQVAKGLALRVKRSRA